MMHFESQLLFYCLDAVNWHQEGYPSCKNNASAVQKVSLWWTFKFRAQPDLSNGLGKPQPRVLIASDQNCYDFVELLLLPQKHCSFVPMISDSVMLSHLGFLCLLDSVQHL